MECPHCHKNILNIQLLTRDGLPICPHCGHVEDRDFENVWLCEECGEVETDWTGDRRPHCRECREDMVLVIVQDLSPVRGIGTGDEDLDMGLVLLMEAQV